ncbi:MAG: hypothetical protein SPD44_04475 [Prevotella sp.]|nr:hypothetical protein [Prevotella sp.]
MNKIEIEVECRKKEAELIEKYFPNFIHEVALEQPEVLTDGYNDVLPHRIEQEYREWLSELWNRLEQKGDRSFDEIMNLHLSMSMVDASYVPYLKDAGVDARKRTLWEKITQTNHEDVRYYKGLLKQYTEELLATMTRDFIGDIEG